ncbi:alpha/beta hydrolase [Sphingosinithalassobacter tenebrarum]|uniref:Alpha/beta hydrolase n=2 Tax=Stakelama tenebrarum TaxID=2711215 RepID=A0A6G6YA79_9SPHN|nr:alpha/beta hydrolase [Sphingosinithalassobacter tenebrarum]
MDHISIVKMGQGPAVFLIPGLSSPRAVWDSVAPELAKTHSVYLVQVNGFAGGDPRGNLEPGVLDGLVSDLHGFMADRGISGAAVVGHSMGGLAGLMLAKAHPGDVGKLMVVDALPFIGTLFAPDATVEMVEPQAAAMRDQMASLHGKPYPDAMAQQIAASNALKPESRARVAEWVKAADARVSAQAMYDDMTTDMRPAMAGITTPITLLYPFSAMLPQERADAVYQGAYADAPQVDFVPVGDSGHFIMLDQPEIFAETLTAFLD